MMLGQIWWVGTMCAAFVSLVAKLYPHFTVTEILLASIPVGTIGGAWVSYLVSCIFNEISNVSIVVSTILVLLITWEFMHEFRTKWRRVLKDVSAEAKGNWLLWLNLAVWGYIVVPLYWTRYLPEDERGNVYSGGSCWADLSIHLHMAYSFLYGRNSDVSFYDLASPIFAGGKMSYPFLPDWHAAVLYRIGSPMRHAMMNPGIALFFAFVGLMYCLTQRLVRSKVAATVCVALVILAGGMGGLSLVKEKPFREIMALHDPIQDTAKEKGGVLWFAFLPHIFLPQRGATFAYPMVLVVFLLMWNIVTRNTTEKSKNQSVSDDTQKSQLLLVAAVFSASLPLVQAHSFVALGLTIGILFLMEFPRWMGHPVQLFGWLGAAIAALVLSAPQLENFLTTALYGGADGQGTFMSFRPIWSHTFTIPPTFWNYWWFWWNSLGAAVPLFTLAFLWWSVPVFQIVLDWFRSTKDTSSSTENEALVEAKRKALLNSADDSTEIYQYGGKRPVNEDEDMLLRRLLTWCAKEYEPIQKFALNVEGIIQRHNAGCAFDAFKFAFCGLVLWFVSNLVIFQPWDRDNCKILYIALFLLTPFSAKLLTFALEHSYMIFRGGYQTVLSAAHKRDDGDTADVKGTVPGNFHGELGIPPCGLLKHKNISILFAFISILLGPVLLYYSCFSGGLSIVREYHLFHVMYDKHAVEIGEYMRNELPPKGVTVHDDTHLSPAGFYAGRQSLVAYTGWTSSHGYDYHERHRDREHIMANLLKESDRRTYSLLRKWGVRYVLAENPREHSQDRSRRMDDRSRRRRRDRRPPPKDMYLDRKLKRLHTSGRYQLFEVRGYGFPPQ